MSSTLMSQNKKKNLKQFRDDLLQLVKKRKHYIDPRSRNFFMDSIQKAKQEKLDTYKTTFTNVKYLELQGKLINKQNFKDIFEQTKNVSKEYKVTVFGNYKLTFPKSKNKASNSKTTKEALTTFTITGKQLKKVKKLAEKKAEEFRDYDPTPDSGYNINKTMTSSDYVVSPVYKQDISMMKVPMKSAYTMDREWLKHAEGIDKKAYDDMKGECVYELLCTHLGDYWKTITKQKLFEVFNEYVDSQTRSSYLDDAPFHQKFTMESGVNTHMIRYLCEKKKISLYAFDAKENCFEKVVFSHVSNYKPIMYYCIDGHMYLITDKVSIKSISNNRANSALVVSSLLEGEQKKKKDERTYMECATFSEAIAQQNCTVYLPQAHMTTEVHAYIAEHKKIPKTKVSNHQIIQVDIKKQNLTIICDPNVVDGYTWKQVKNICEKVDVPFTNQRVGGLIAAMRKKFFKPERRFLSEEEKSELCEQQELTCKTCKKKYIKTEFEYDHIVPLAMGGSNEFANFQALCKGCHLQKTNEERENGDFIKFDEVASTFNEEALKIVQSQAFKQWAFVEKMKSKVEDEITTVFDGYETVTKREYVGQEKVEKQFQVRKMRTVTTPKTLHKIDHAKCRRNLVMHGKYDFPQFSVMDYPSTYDGQDIKVGVYYVKTENYYPFRGSGWYPYCMVLEALAANIISKENITYQFISSFSIKNNYFKNFAQHLIDSTKDAELDKLIVNSMVGCWGIQRSEYESIEMTLDKYHASRELIRDGVFVQSNQLNNETTLYSIIERMVINKDDMYLPLYNQIIAMEAMELWKLENMIVAKGGVPMERNTDAVLYAGPVIDISGVFWDEEKSVPKYRYDETTFLKVQEVCKFVRSDSFKPAEFKWKEYSEQSMNHMFDDGTIFFNVFLENDDFGEMAQGIFDSGESCQILGVSGAGKTTMANKIIDLIEKSGKKCIKLAPTRKAASHIKGMTIHKYYLSLFLSNNYEKKILKSLNHMDYMIIDEISMVKEVFYRFFTLLKRYAPNLKFIIIGDYDQLKPVKDKYTGDYRNSPALHHLCDGNRISLEKCRRSDNALFELYDGVRRETKDVDISQFPVNELTSLNIAYTHNTRKNVNKVCMDKFVGNKQFLFCSRLERNHKTQDVKIFEGMPIVSYKNDDKLDIYNSEVFSVHAIDTEKNTFSIMHNDEELFFRSVDFKYYFYPAYCITIHVSQGCTFTQPYTIYDWSHPHMEKSAKYVALSRSTSIHNIQIKN